MAKRDFLGLTKALTEGITLDFIRCPREHKFGENGPLDELVLKLPFAMIDESFGSSEDPRVCLSSFSEAFEKEYVPLAARAAKLNRRRALDSFVGKFHDPTIEEDVLKSLRVEEHSFLASRIKEALGVAKLPRRHSAETSVQVEEVLRLSSKGLPLEECSRYFGERVARAVGSAADSPELTELCAGGGAGLAKKFSEAFLASGNVGGTPRPLPKRSEMDSTEAKEAVRKWLAGELILPCPWEVGSLAGNAIVGAFSLLDEAFAGRDAPEAIEHYVGEFKKDVGPKAANALEEEEVRGTARDTLLRMVALSESGSETLEKALEAAVGKRKYLVESQRVEKAFVSLLARRGAIPPAPATMPRFLGHYIAYATKGPEAKDAFGREFAGLHSHDAVRSLMGAQGANPRAHAARILDLCFGGGRKAGELFVLAVEEAGHE